MYTWNQSWLWIWIYYHTKSSITFNLMTLDTHTCSEIDLFISYVIFSPRYNFFFMCKQLEFRWLMPWIDAARCWIQTSVNFQSVVSSVFNSLTGMEFARLMVLPAILITVVRAFTTALPTMKKRTEGWRVLLPLLHTTKLLLRAVSKF